MCGIAGYIGTKVIHETRIQETLGLMKNRGPDARHFISKRDGHLNITLLNSRLAIIDLEERSNQPFSIDGAIITYNGEIYNYVELRKKMKKKGVIFKTQSDTEVLLQSYLHDGEECVKDFEGMWSFAIYDQKRKKLFLSRDRFAEKPLYYVKTQDGFYFGSEIKFIKALSGIILQINKQQLLRYLVNGYKSLYKEKDTFFKEIQEVPYATNLIFDEKLQIRQYRYWRPSVVEQQMTLKEAIEGFREKLIESINLRLRADVPLAFCLSGGIDSSAIVSIASKVLNYNVSTFSIIDEDERYNEYDNVLSTIDDLKCESNILKISKDYFWERLTHLIRYHDAPIYTITYYIHSFLSEAISKKKYKVVTSGTAADELVTGYYDHFNLHLYEMRGHPRYQQYLSDWRDHISHIVRNPHLQNPEFYMNQPDARDHIYLNHLEFSNFLRVKFHEPFSEEKFCISLLRNRMLNELFHEATPVVLHEDDLNSMLYSVENRSPYLDSNLFEFSYSIPNQYLIQNGYGKYVLREAMKGILNDKVRLDRRKKGFNASIHSLIDFKDKKNMEFLLKDSPIYEYVDKAKIEKCLGMYPMPNSYSKFAFNFINAKIFLELHG